MNRIKDLSLLFLRFLITLFKSRSLVYDLARRDIRSKYLGSYLNFLWAFVQPTITILLLWFVFDVGFKVPPVEKYPFILWLIPSINPSFSGLNIIACSLFTLALIARFLSTSS